MQVYTERPTFFPDFLYTAMMETDVMMVYSVSASELIGW